MRARARTGLEINKKLPYDALQVRWAGVQALRPNVKCLRSVSISRARLLFKVPEGSFSLRLLCV